MSAGTEDPDLLSVAASISTGGCVDWEVLEQTTSRADETELLRYCEDPEWSYRALVKGYEIHFIPAITVTHVH